MASSSSRGAKELRRKRRKEKAQARRDRPFEAKPLFLSNMPMPQVGALSAERWTAWVEERAAVRDARRAELLGLLESSSWPVLLAAAFLYNNTVGFNDGDPVEIDDEPIQPAIEYMQVLALTLPPDRTELAPVPGADTQRALELAKEIVFDQTVPKSFPGGSDDHDRSMVLHLLQVHAATVRGPGYPHQIEFLTRAVLARTRRSEALDPVFLADLIGWLDAEVERRLNAFRGVLGPAIKIDTWEAAEAHVFQFLHPSEESLAAFRSWRAAGSPGGVALAVLETRLVDVVFSFAPAQLIDEFGEQRGGWGAAALERWSIAPGGLAGTVLDYLIGENPVWTRPIVKLDDQLYFLPIPTVLTSFRWELIERALEGDQDQLESYWKARSNVLEEATATEMGRLFGPDAVHRSAKWVDPTDGKQYETDVLVVYDRCIIVVECKAHAARGPARRGSPDRAKKLGRGVFHDAGRQSARLRALLDGGGAVEMATDRGPLRIEPDGHRLVERLTVTIDFIGSLASRRDAQAALAQAGSIEDFAIAMPITDLQIVVDALEIPERALHYLQQRPSLETRFYFAGDETDLLALYLRTRFSSGFLKEVEGGFLHLGSLGRTFDSWYLPSPGLAAGPSGRLTDTPFWSGILKQVRTSGGHGWLRTAAILVGVPIELQRDAERSVRRLRKRVSRARRFLAEKNMLVVEAAWDQSEVIVFVVHPDAADRDAVRQQVQDAAQAILDQDGRVSVALVIALRETPLSEYAYSMALTAVR